MIAIHHERANFWLRLKHFFALGGANKNTAAANNSQPKPKRRPHRTTAFFDMP